MMVTFVSQCEKKALNRTRRVLDSFANRIGDNTWQTVITNEGLNAVKKLLRKTASKSTAVSCFWIRSRSRSELVWVVGNRAKFNAEGVVPVNRTKLNLDHKDWEDGWQLNEMIVLASSIAGLFHDFGKANDLFQSKLKGLTESKGEPYRHEWVSLRLFEAFVKNKTDKEWLNELVTIEQEQNAADVEKVVLENIFRDSEGYQNPFKYLPPFAKMIAWLIVSHHRLPMSHDKKNPPKVNESNKWIDSCFNCHWNSKNAVALENIDKNIVDENWMFSEGTPFISNKWQERASYIAQRALNYPQLFKNNNWFQQRFVSHLSRLSLMLADHYYSSLNSEESKQKWRDDSYKANANTDRALAKKTIKQKLDEHNIGVANNAMRFSLNLPALKYTLPAIAQHKLFISNVRDEKYRWQNKAFKIAKEIAKATEKQGFFGINMASTGCGKTIANARIMYGLSDQREGCRFSVALGLRTLTLQTGDAYRDLLKLGDDELAVLIGSQAVKTLHQLKKEDQYDRSTNGSESSDDLFDKLFISYEGQIYDGRLKRWLSASPKLEQMISAPILVSTIDHLMPATESKRGGKQIAPMLRLLTSDLVLDEPDDFGLEDLPALCRLVNWAGMLGSRVLLSSATLPPSLINALYDAYVAGREQFNQANYLSSKSKGIVCAWFDENKSEMIEAHTRDTFIEKNKSFVTTRLVKLQKDSKHLRQGKLVTVPADSGELFSGLAQLMQQQIYQLHVDHHVQNHNGRKVSIGVVRMANIKPMIALAKALTSLPVKSDYSFHLCIYHSQFPLALRSYKEMRLDKMLTRYDEQDLWQHQEVKNALKNTQTKNNVFIVLGTSVVEVGRDHDYDWAIAEPSSLRAIIQLAGRIQRHRQISPKSPNIIVLNKNIKALKGDSPAYCNPGFETTAQLLSSNDLSELLTNELDDISAIPRIIEPQFTLADFMVDKKDKNKNRAKNPAYTLAVQEHRALKVNLDKVDLEQKGEAYRTNKEASLWWKIAMAWSAEFIRQTEFRKSYPKEDFVLRIPKDEGLGWYQLDATKYPAVYIPQNNRFNYETIQLGQGNHWWLLNDTEQIYQQFADRLNKTLEQVSNDFGVISLREAKDDHELKWHWNENLGVFDAG